jgi:hypothetical protein
VRSRHVAPLVALLLLLPARAHTQEGFELAVPATPDGTIWVVTPNAIYRSTQVLLAAPGPTSSGSATGATVTGASETGATGATASPTASPSPAGAAGRFGGPGLIVLGLLIGGFLLLRTRLLRRQP